MRPNSRIKRFPHLIFVFGRWALGAGRWALGVGRWTLGAGRWALGTVGVGGEEKQDVESEVRVGGKS